MGFEGELEGLEVDLDVAECGEILETHGIKPTVALVIALWEWKEDRKWDSRG